MMRCETVRAAGAACGNHLPNICGHEQTEDWATGQGPRTGVDTGPGLPRCESLHISWLMTHYTRNHLQPPRNFPKIHSNTEEQQGLLSLEANEGINSHFIAMNAFCWFCFIDCVNNLDYKSLFDRNKISTLLHQCSAQYNKEFYFLDVDQKSNNLNVLLVTSWSAPVVTGSIIAPHDPIITDNTHFLLATLYRQITSLLRVILPVCLCVSAGPRLRPQLCWVLRWFLWILTSAQRSLRSMTVV